MQFKFDTRNNVQYFEEYIPVNGIKEYILVYPKAETSTMIIHLHGGPGSPDTPYIPLFFPRDLPVSLAYYDARGAGKTQFLNKNLAEDITIDNLIEDLYATINWIKSNLKIDNIILACHSFGSILAMEFLARYPAEVEAYIGIGQVISTVKSERLNLENLSAKILREGYSEEDKIAIKKIKEDAYPETSDLDRFLTDMIGIRHLSNVYNRSYCDMPSKWKLLKSYTVRFKDFKWMKDLTAIISDNVNLLKFLQTYEVNGRSFQFPLFFIAGETDYIAPIPLIEEYMEKMKLPMTNLYRIANSGHQPQYENPEGYRTVLREIIQKIDDAVETAN